MRTYASSGDASGLRFAVVVARFNQPVSVRLLEACTDELVKRGADPDEVDVAVYETREDGFSVEFNYLCFRTNIFPDFLDATHRHDLVSPDRYGLVDCVIRVNCYDFSVYQGQRGVIFGGHANYWADGCLNLFTNNW